MLNNSITENFFNELQDLLNEIKNEQIKLEKNVEQNHKINMKNFAKLKEFNEICDMTNQVFETRLSNIEALLEQISKCK